MRSPGRLGSRLGRKARRRLGQHFLVDAAVIDYETAMARVDGERVLEIGGGTGNLTAAVAKHAKRLVTVEKDPALASALRSKFAGMKNTKVVESDFLALNPSEFEADVIVGNIPYSLSSQILFRLRDWQFNRALLCVQKEFAERMVAQPGNEDYSRLSVMTQLYFRPIFLKTVPKGCFSPVPEIDSAIVFLTPKGTAVDEERDELIRMLFIHKNRTLTAALKAREFTKLRDRITRRAKDLGIEDKRIFKLSLEEILKLTG